MKKITKSFLLSTCFLFGLATFSHATRISELFENEDMLHFCKLVEKLINFNSSSSELNEILQPGAIERYFREFSQLRHKEAYDYFRLFCTIKLCKDIPLEEENDDYWAFATFYNALRCRERYYPFFITYCITNIKDISQDDIDFLNSPFFIRILKKMDEIRLKYDRINHSAATQQAPKKSSCTIL